MFSEQLKPFSLETFGDLFSAMASFALADNHFEQSVETDDADFPTATPKRSLFQSPGSEQKKGPGTSPKVPSAMKASPKKKGSPKKKATKALKSPMTGSECVSSNPNVEVKKMYFLMF